MSYNKSTGLYDGFIYCITNTCNGKRYIGQTLNTVDQRFREHKRVSVKNPYNLYLYTAFQKYGAYNFCVFEICKISFEDKEQLKSELNRLEIKYIKEFNTQKPDGYNMTPGGQSAGNTFIAKPVTQYTLDGCAINTYESISEASRATGIGEGDISACCCGVKIHRTGKYVFRFKEDRFDPTSVISVKHFAQYDLDGNLVRVYESLKDAELKTKVKISSISMACTNHDTNGANRTAGGWMWKSYINGYDISQKIQPYKSNRKVKIVQKNKNGDVINTYNSMREASELSGVNRTTIKNCCRGITVSPRRYLWEYAS